MTEHFKKKFPQVKETFIFPSLTHSLPLSHTHKHTLYSEIFQLKNYEPDSECEDKPLLMIVFDIIFYVIFFF